MPSVHGAAADAKRPAKQGVLTTIASERAPPVSTVRLLMRFSVKCASLPDVEGSSAAHLVAACLLQGIGAETSALAHWAS